MSGLRVPEVEDHDVMRQNGGCVDEPLADDSATVLDVEAERAVSRPGPQDLEARLAAALRTRVEQCAAHAGALQLGGGGHPTQLHGNRAGHFGAGLRYP